MHATSSVLDRLATEYPGVTTRELDIREVNHYERDMLIHGGGSATGHSSSPPATTTSKRTRPRRLPSSRTSRSTLSEAGEVTSPPSRWPCVSSTARQSVSSQELTFAS